MITAGFIFATILLALAGALCVIIGREARRPPHDEAYEETLYRLECEAWLAVRDAQRRHSLERPDAVLTVADALEAAARRLRGRAGIVEG